MNKNDMFVNSQSYVCDMRVKGQMSSFPRSQIHCYMLRMYAMENFFSTTANTVITSCPPAVHEEQQIRE